VDSLVLFGAIVARARSVCARIELAKVYCSTRIEIDIDVIYENLLHLFALSSRSAVPSGVRSGNRAHV
jgi:hypothetical protein